MLISQRVSSIRHADKIVVLDDGRMAGLGTHAELQQHLPGLSGDLPVAGEGGGECIVKHTSSWALRRVIKSLGRYLPLLLVSLLLAAASVAGTLYIPILVGDAIDQIVGPGQVDFAAVGTSGGQNCGACRTDGGLAVGHDGHPQPRLLLRDARRAPPGVFPLYSGCRLRIWTAIPPATRSAA